jgi:hypothetical protein
MAATLLLAAVPVMAGAATPGYDHLRQFISELGETGAAHGRLVSLGGFLPVGLLVLVFLWAGLPALRWNRRTTAALICLSGVGWGYVVAALAPCDPGCPYGGTLAQNLHTLAGFFHYGGAAAGLFLFAAAARSSPRWRPLWPLTLAAAVVALVGGLGMLLLPEWDGLFQRVAESGFFGWTAVVCVRLLLGPARPN